MDHMQNGATHDKHQGHDPEMFRRLFWSNLVLAIPVIVFSGQVQDWLGYSISGRGTGWIAPTLGSVIYLWGGRPFLLGGWAEARSRQPGMMLLITLAISVAYFSSLASSIGVGELDFWWELAALITVMLLGHWQEMRAIGQARGALHALAELLPDEAERIVAGGTQHVSTAELSVSDIVVVRPGGRVPADGVVVEGEASFDESMITGESRPVRHRVGDPVVTGTVSTDSPVRVRVRAVGSDTALAGIQRLVADAQASRSRSQALADRAAMGLFYIAVAAAIVTMIAWSASGDSEEGVIRTVTVLVIACPHALGLAIPLVISISTATSARSGILVKDRLALERMRTVDVVLFDKTGTLTRGNHAVVGHAAIEGFDAEHMLMLAAAAEKDSEHPIARAVRASVEPPAETWNVADQESSPGVGVTARVEDQLVAVGGPALLHRLGLGEPSELAPLADQWRAEGGSVVYVAVDSVVVGAMTLADEIRPESAAAVTALHDHGKDVMLITGDAPQVAASVATRLSIDDVLSEVLPGEKDDQVEKLQQSGRTVAMVGDGVNDAPALARADVGIAIGAGTDVAMESAGVILASSDPRGVVGVIELSRASYRKMVQNLAWATSYNLLAIPVAAGSLAFAGVTIAPAVAAVAMSLSTIVVAANAQLLRRLDLRPDTVSRIS